MSKVRCPSCGFKGELRGTEEFFEIRGRHPTSRMPVRRCRNCGAGFEVRFLVPFVWPKARAIPPEFWRQMEASWEWDVVGSEHGRRPLAQLAEREEELRRRREDD